LLDNVLPVRFTQICGFESFYSVNKNTELVTWHTRDKQNKCARFDHFPTISLDKIRFHHKQANRI